MMKKALYFSVLAGLLVTAAGWPADSRAGRDPAAVRADTLLHSHRPVEEGTASASRRYHGPGREELRSYHRDDRHRPFNYDHDRFADRWAYRRQHRPNEDYGYHHLAPYRSGEEVLICTRRGGALSCYRDLYPRYR